MAVHDSKYNFGSLTHENYEDVGARCAAASQGTRCSDALIKRFADQINTYEFPERATTEVQGEVSAEVRAEAPITRTPVVETATEMMVYQAMAS